MCRASANSEWVLVGMVAAVCWLACLDTRLSIRCFLTTTILPHLKCNTGLFRALVLALCCLCCFAVAALLFERLSPLPGIRISRGKLRPVYAFDGLRRCSGSAERKNERKKEGKEERKKERKKERRRRRRRRRGYRDSVCKSYAPNKILTWILFAKAMPFLWFSQGFCL